MTRKKPNLYFLLIAAGLAVAACKSDKTEEAPAATKTEESKPSAAMQGDSQKQAAKAKKASDGEFNPADFTKAPRRVTASAELKASPEEVWAYVSNHDNLVAYSGGSLSHASVDRKGAKEHNGVGTQRHCEMPDGSKFAETVVFFRAPKLFAYTLEANNSWGLSDHLGVVRVEPTNMGARLTFELYFNHPKTDMMVKNITGLITMRMLPHFTEKFGGEVKGG